ncbi:MAG: 4Fe-4S binding protein [Nitrospirae bacterium]|nr:4Fe-4S binding protein [Nitrospirota bacterium]
MKLVFVSKQFERAAFDLSHCDPEELVMVIDTDRCISCGSCELACQLERGGRENCPASFRPTGAGPGRQENEHAVHLPLSCRHCDTPCDYYSQYNFWITCPSNKREDGKTVPCDFCAERLKEGLWPACATRCTMKAIYFGPVKDIAFVLREKRLREMGDVALSS